MARIDCIFLQPKVARTAPELLRMNIMWFLRSLIESGFAADASPDGDALQAFEWASNPPGELEHA